MPAELRPSSRCSNRASSAHVSSREYIELLCGCPPVFITIDITDVVQKVDARTAGGMRAASNM